MGKYDILIFRLRSGFLHRIQIAEADADDHFAALRHKRVDRLRDIRVIFRYIVYDFKLRLVQPELLHRLRNALMMRIRISGRVILTVDVNRTDQKIILCSVPAASGAAYGRSKRHAQNQNEQY